MLMVSTILRFRESLHEFTKNYEAVGSCEQFAQKLYLFWGGGLSSVHMVHSTLSTIAGDSCDCNTR